VHPPSPLVLPPPSVLPTPHPPHPHPTPTATHARPAYNECANLNQHRLWPRRYYPGCLYGAQTFVESWTFSIITQMTIGARCGRG
jgi:hypothetical protein